LTVDKQSAHAGIAHLAKGYFLRSAREGGHRPWKPQPGPRNRRDRLRSLPGHPRAYPNPPATISGLPRLAQWAPNRPRIQAAETTVPRPENPCIECEQIPRIFPGLPRCAAALFRLRTSRAVVSDWLNPMVFRVFRVFPWWTKSCGQALGEAWPRATRSGTGRGGDVTGSRNS
jgi:hypothetical protein